VRVVAGRWTRVPERRIKVEFRGCSHRAAEPQFRLLAFRCHRHRVWCSDRCQNPECSMAHTVRCGIASLRDAKTRKRFRRAAGKRIMGSPLRPGARKGRFAERVPGGGGGLYFSLRLPKRSGMFPNSLGSQISGVWRSPVARRLWEPKVPGSNPGAPIEGPQCGPPGLCTGICEAERSSSRRPDERSAHSLISAPFSFRTSTLAFQPLPTGIRDEARRRMGS
jgi:hypothetical protein